MFTLLDTTLYSPDIEKMENDMRIGTGVFIGIGANLAADGYRDAYQTCLAAIESLFEYHNIKVLKVSSWYETAPVPISDQPWFVNAVLEVETSMAAGALLRALHGVEDQFGRQRRVRNEARVLDLDLLDFDGALIKSEGAGLTLPHPRMAARAFVLYPLRDLAPNWQHPETGRVIADLIHDLPDGQTIRLFQL